MSTEPRLASVPTDELVGELARRDIGSMDHDQIALVTWAAVQQLIGYTTSLGDSIKRLEPLLDVLEPLLDGSEQISALALVRGLMGSRG